MDNFSEYYPKEIEAKWQEKWRQEKTFEAETASQKPKYYILDMFPYPSGAGLHIGHPEGYTATDILARYHWAKGYNVLHPMGWDAFGLPAEQHAIQTGIHPAINTEKNIQTFRGQIQRLGFAIDWSREISTTDPEYFRWTQWIFLQLFRKGLAFVDERPVWWCPALKAVLANEEVVNGRSERGNHPVERRALRQWVLRITAYADALLEGLKDLDWPESTKRQQSIWIGRSEGAEVQFKVENSSETLTVYTTRPDTLFGVTYLVLAPEHPLVSKIVTSEQKEAVEQYQKETAAKSDLDRTDLNKNKSGVFTGAYAISPVTGKALPIWISDYVLTSYGTGAIMCVPAHDARDYEFAQKFNLPIQPVVKPVEQPWSDTLLPFTEKGEVFHSEKYDGLSSDEAKKQITQWLEQKKIGKHAVNYKLRDWLFSRQRYWGEPIPIFWVKESDYEKYFHQKSSAFYEFLPEKAVSYVADGEVYCAVPILPEQLPLVAPKVEHYSPAETGESPLANATDWVSIYVNPKNGKLYSAKEIDSAENDLISARRETNTMPQWAGSCWYYLRYMSPRESSRFVNRDAEQYWKCPDFYIGGAEHAVLHLLYARFWHKFLYDQGEVSTSEPFPKLFHQGIILGEDGNKMSKSKGNVINPDTVIQEYGADALRLYEMFLGPLEAMKPWNTKGIEGVSRFLKKVWRLYVSPEGQLSAGIRENLAENEHESAATLRLLHQSIQKVADDIEHLRFNTAISQLMVLLSQLQSENCISLSTAKIFLQLLAPFAPHLSEELWSRLGESDSVVRAAFPVANTALTVEDQMTLAIQVNGKLRGELQVAKNTSKEEVLRLARAQQKVVPYLENKTCVKEIYVPSKIVNFVVRDA